jgi:LppP/LprE lipoprotein
MGAFSHTLAGGGRNRGPARWARRIAGLVATGALLAVAVAILTMLLPGSDSAPPETAASAPAATPTPAKADKQASQPAGLTPAQKHARSAAVSELRTQGYLPVRLRDYDPHHTLRVLVGYRAGDVAGPRRAFFFTNGRLVGTDSFEPSSNLKVSASGKRWVTLTYGVYSPGDSSCCPSNGHKQVRYELSGSAVTPVGGTIPASYQRVATG